jgi:hypothetical protein
MALAFCWSGQQTQAQEDFKDYKSIKDIQDRIKDLADKYKDAPASADVIKKDGNPIETEVTKEDKENKLGPHNIYYMKIGKGDKKFLLTGNIHAREWIAYYCALDTAQWLLENKGNEKWPAEFKYFTDNYPDTSPKKLFDSGTFLFIPVVNPSGYAYSRENDPKLADPNGFLAWRKNRRPTKDDPSGDPVPPMFPNRDDFLKILIDNKAIPEGTKADVALPFIGVDLNRNFPITGTPGGKVDWGTVTWQGEAGKSLPTTVQLPWFPSYCGRPDGGKWNAKPLKPNVEKETLAVTTLVEAQTNIVGSVDLHSFLAFVGYPQSLGNKLGRIDLKKDPAADDKIVPVLAKRAGLLTTAKADGPYDTNDKGTPYPGSGDLHDWMYHRKDAKTLAFLIEIGKKNFHPTNASDYAVGLRPCTLFMMLASFDNSFGNKPTGEATDK